MQAGFAVRLVVPVPATVPGRRRNDATRRECGFPDAFVEEPRSQRLPVSPGKQEFEVPDFPVRQSGCPGGCCTCRALLDELSSMAQFADQAIVAQTSRPRSDLAADEELLKPSAAND